MTDKDLKVGYAGSVPGETVDDALLRYLARREKVDRAILRALITLLNGEWIGTGQQGTLKMLRETLKELEGE